MLSRRMCAQPSSSATLELASLGRTTSPCLMVPVLTVAASGQIALINIPAGADSAVIFCAKRFDSCTSSHILISVKVPMYKGISTFKHFPNSPGPSRCADATSSADSRNTAAAFLKPFGINHNGECRILIKIPSYRCFTAGENFNDSPCPSAICDSIASTQFGTMSPL